MLKDSSYRSVNDSMKGSNYNSFNNFIHESGRGEITPRQNVRKKNLVFALV